MTREEAIKFWKFRYENAKDYTDPHWEAQERREHREYVEALRVTIEALKTEPIKCGECENYIDRRCIEANHHVAAHGNCMNVFGAKRREL